MGEGVKIGGGTSLAIDGLEQIGELKLTTKCQWVGERIPMFSNTNPYTPTSGFSYNDEIHSVYGRRHKKLVNGTWVDDVSLPVSMTHEKGGFCEGGGYAYLALAGKIYRFNGTKWTNILTISNAESGASSYDNNIVCDNGKLYYSYGKKVYIINLSTLSYTTTADVAVLTSGTYYGAGKIFMLNGKLHSVFYAYYNGASSYSTGIYRYDEASNTWSSVGKVPYIPKKPLAPIVRENVAYIISNNHEITFDGDTVNFNPMTAQFIGTMFMVKNQQYLIGYANQSQSGSSSPVEINGLFAYKKTLYLEV